MEEKRDIRSTGDIKVFVDAFYLKVRNDELLSPVFSERIGDHWEPHLQRMYSFWQTLLIEEHTYKGNPFAHHVNLPINKEHFDRWLELFHQTLDELFAGPKATEAKVKGSQIGAIFLSKLGQIKGT
ncbi:MAG TPA: group III truncated hemoglobin [Bacteroidia bacterium]|jgi:hemoglobin